MFWELLLSYTFRSILGICTATGLAVVGYFGAGTIRFPSLGFHFFIAFPVCCAGVGAGIGGFACWLRRGYSRVIIFTTLVLTLAGGLAGAWGGFLCGRMAYEEPAYSCAGVGGLTILLAIIISAGFAANSLPLLASIYWARHHWGFY